MFNQSTYQHIPAIFKAVRKFNKLQQTEFAEIVEVTQGTISKIESGNMSAELGLWFKFLKAFNIQDPYCFTYGGVEFHEDSFLHLTEEGSALAPGFTFFKEDIIFNVRTIRPIFDYLIKNHTTAFESFLKKNRINIEIFYILNHPLSYSFVDTFFSYLEEHKVNENKVNNMDLNFGSVYGSYTDKKTNFNIPENFFDFLNEDLDSFAKFKLDKNNNTYSVSINKNKLNLIDSLKTKNYIINYNALYPFHFLRSTKQWKNINPVITEVKKGLEWQVAFAS